MKFAKHDILFQEVPNEISLGFYIVGCNKYCTGCHSPELWESSRAGTLLDEDLLLETLHKYSGYISCVLFLGGEWEPLTLISYLEIILKKGLKTALYTGEVEIQKNIREKLTYLKLGPWMASRGGLRSKTTNQEFWDVEKKLKLNHLFQT